jgi:SAM-dependent methyltransferase
MVTIRKYLPLLPLETLEGRVVLDLGSGYGLVANLLAFETKIQIIGLEISERRAKVAAQANIANIVNIKGNVEFHGADVTLATQFPPSDLILALDVMCGFSASDQVEILHKAYKSLNKNGVLIVKDTDKSPKWKYYYTYLEDLIKVKLGLYKGQLNYRSESEFRQLFMQTKFEIIEVIHIYSYTPYPGIIYVCRKGA